MSPARLPCTDVSAPSVITDHLYKSSRNNQQSRLLQTSQISTASETIWLCKEVGELGSCAY